MAGWATGDNHTEKRRNREWGPLRLLMPVFDIANGGSVTASAAPADGNYVTTGEATHYTAGSGISVSVIKNITITNHEAGSNTARVHLVPNGGSRQAANAIYFGTLYLKETVSLSGPFFIDPSDTVRSISSDASGTDLSLRIDYEEWTGHPAGVTCIVDDGDALTTSFATYYTCPASNVQHSNAIVLACNTHTAAVDVEIAVIPSGQAQANRYNIFTGSLRAGDTLFMGDVLEPFILEPGDFIQAKASTGAVVAFRVTPVEYATP